MHVSLHRTVVKVKFLHRRYRNAIFRRRVELSGAYRIGHHPVDAISQGLEDQGFERVFQRLRDRYHRLLQGLVFRRKVFIPSFLGTCALVFALVPFLGEDFFPKTDSGQFILHVRGPSGMRIEEAARLFDLVEDQIRDEIPAAQIDNILDNIGLPYSNLNTQHLTNGSIGNYDGDILVSLKENHSPTANYVKALRSNLPRMFPQAKFYLLPADITTQILNFGQPAPIDIQIEGNDIRASKVQADKILEQLRQVPGLADLRIQQPFDYPIFSVNVDRTKASQGGYTEHDVATSVLNTLSGSFQVTPMFFLNWKNMVNYNLVTQTPQYKMDTMQDLQNIPINRTSNVSGAGSASSNPEILNDLRQSAWAQSWGL